MRLVNIRVLLADDHKMLLAGLRALIEKEAGLEVVGEAADGRTALSMARKQSPDVVVMDIAMPGLNGVEATRQITAQVPGAKVIALSMHSEEKLVKAMLAAGASGYVLKECAFEELAHAVRWVAKGKTYLSPGIADIVVRAYAHPTPRYPTSEPLDAAALTAREREVLQLLAEGKTTHDVASCLCVSPKTARTHRQHIMDKLGIHSLAELTKYAVCEGITSLQV